MKIRDSLKYRSPIDVESLSEENLASLKRLYGLMGLELGHRACALFRKIIQVNCCSVEEISYDNVTMSLPNPTLISIFSCGSLPQKGLVEINPSILHPLLGREVSESAVGPEDYFICDHILLEVLKVLRESWLPILDIDFRQESREISCRRACIADPRDKMIIACFEVLMGDHSGMLNIVMPLSILDVDLGVSE